MKSVVRAVVAPVILIAAGLVVGASLYAEDEETRTGWSNSAAVWSAKDAHDFFDVNNWYSGLITGEFGFGLGTSKVTEYIKFGDDWRGNLLLGHSNEATLWFVGDGTRDATWYLPGDVTLAPSTAKGSVNFGDTAEGRRFIFNLGGKRRKLSLSGPAYYVNSPIGDGEVEIDSTASLVSFRGSTGRIEGDAVFTGKKFQFTKGTEAGLVRVQNLDCGAAEFEVWNGDANPTMDIIGGTLRITDETGNMKKVSVNTSKTNAVLRVGRLEVAPGGFVEFAGTRLGWGPVGEAIGSLLVDEVPAMIGGVIPQTIALDVQGNVSFATYDAKKGVRPLDLETEFVSDVALLTRGDENLFVPHGTSSVISGDVTVNAVLTGGGEAQTYTTIDKGTDGGSLRVLSGLFVVGWARYKTPSVNVPVDFGSVRGCIAFAQDKRTDWKSCVSGTGGVVFSAMSATTSGTGMTIWHDCDYTGDSYVNGPLTIENGFKVFPFGERTGDTWVNGTLSFCGSSSGKTAVQQTLNGLNGSGTIRCAKYLIDLTIGDNDATGDFSGTMTDFQNVIKVGAGCQRLGGAVTLKSQALSVRAGRLVLDGAVSGGTQMSVASGAELGGRGTVAMPVAFADGAKFVVGIADNKPTGPLTVASLSADGPIEVSADTGDWRGSAVVLKVTDGTLEGITFRKGPHIGSLSLSEDMTELRVSKESGFVLKIR